LVSTKPSGSVFGFEADVVVLELLVVVLPPVELLVCDGEPVELPTVPVEPAELLADPAEPGDSADEAEPLPEPDADEGPDS
jgi:hypothetical protein